MNGVGAIAISETESETIYMWKDVYESLPTIENSVTGKVLSNNGLYPEWVDMPKGDKLPDQTGNAGKFLKTNGSEVSWGEALVNMATGVASLQILGIPDLGVRVDFSTVVGQNAHVFGNNCTAIGYNASCEPGTTFAIQLGEGQNADSNTFKVANANGNFEIMDANGNVPLERLTYVTNQIGDISTALTAILGE